MKNLSLIKVNLAVLGFSGVAKMVYSKLFNLLNKRNPVLAQYFLQRKHNIVLRYVAKIYAVKDEVNLLPPKQHLVAAPVWVFWWQGEDFAPAVVKKCIESIRKHTKGYEVIILSKDNIVQYIDIPDYVMGKVGCSITLTHFSDLLRLALVSTYGGGWVDATLYLTGDIPQYVAEYSYFTIKNEFRKFFCVSSFRWTNGFLFSKKGNHLVEDLYRMLFAYWRYNSGCIDYFLLDYCEAYLYDHVDTYRHMIDDVPVTNTRMFLDGLYDHLNQLYDENVYQKITADTWVHKLSYKQNFDEEGNTFYHHIINS